MQAARQTRLSARWLWLLAAVFWLIALSRFIRVDGFEFNSDETWMIWQTLGTPRQIVLWAPDAWPSLGMLLLAGWRVLVGMHPLVMRTASILVWVLGAALTFRMAERLSGSRRAALLTVLLYSALGHAIYNSMIVRPYSLVMGLLALGLWLTMRYFERPTVGRGLALGLCLAFMFHMHLTSAVAFVVLGLYTLLEHRRALWRWWLPGVVGGVLALPEVLNRLTILNRGAIKFTADVRFESGIVDLFAQFVGDWALLWLAGGVLATGLLLYRRRFKGLSFVLLWTLGGATGLYLLNDALGFFTPRYAWWLMLGLVLWLGWGLAQLPRRAVGLVALAAAAAMFAPIPLEAYSFMKLVPFEDNFTLLQQHWRPGDVILVDPECRNAGCRHDYEWNYYAAAYFPHGLKFVEQPGEHRRVWYVSQSGWNDKDLEAALMQTHVRSVFFGPWDFLFQLYEAPPDPEGLRFENGMRFHGFDVLGRHEPQVWRETETFTVRLWWSVDAPLPHDYSVALHLMEGGALIAQSDGAPQVVHLSPAEYAPLPSETSLWQPGRYYVEQREMSIPYPNYWDDLPLYMVVYQWWDGERIAAPGIEPDKRLYLKTMKVMAW